MDFVQEYVKRIGNWLSKRVKTVEFWLQFAAYFIPILFLLYVLYINFLPFGYNRTFTIIVGSLGDTSGEFHLDPSRSLSNPIANATGTAYRLLSGGAVAEFDPQAVLSNAQITVSVQGSPSVFVIAPQINFDPSSLNWDYSWGFATSTPTDLIGNAFHFDSGTCFDGTDRLQLPNSSKAFDSGPFTVFAEWTPQISTDSSEEIVGHYNWEFLQNKNAVEFQVGRMNNSSGPDFTISYPVTASFFNKEHSALAIYSPSSNGGYIGLYIDNVFIGETLIGTSTISTAYNGKNDLTFGKSAHGGSAYFQGCIEQVDLLNDAFVTQGKQVSFETASTQRVLIPIMAFATSTLQGIILNVNQR